mgnify:CR=1 FL=1
MSIISINESDYNIKKEEGRLIAPPVFPVKNYCLTTFAACGPRSPSLTSNSTWSPS